MEDASEVTVGRTPWPLHVPPEKRVVLVRANDSAPVASPKELMRAALDRLVGLDAPLQRAVAPGDRTVIVLDESLPFVGELLTALLDHLAAAGVPSENVTVVVPPPSGPQTWADELPDEHGDLHVEIHDPDDQTKLAYLATTTAGRRVYLNRTLLDAEFVAVLSARRFDPTFGYTGAEMSIFPALSDAATRAEFATQFSTDAPTAEPNAARAEAIEVGWRLGLPTYLQVIEGADDRVAEVVGGLAKDASTEGVRRHDARWRCRVAAKADLVIVSVSGSSERITFLDLATALACGKRVRKTGGRIVLLTAAAPPLGDAGELLTQVDDPAEAAKLITAHKPGDAAAAALWAFAARKSSLFVASGWPDETTESLFATAVSSAAEVQRLIDAAGSVIVIPDAHKTVVDRD